MTEQDTKKSLVAHKGHFERKYALFEQRMTTFIGNRNEFTLKNLIVEMDCLRKHFDKITEKGEELNESKNEETSKYGLKELEEITERFKKIQEKFDEETSKTIKPEKPKTEPSSYRPEPFTSIC